MEEGEEARSLGLAREGWVWGEVGRQESPTAAKEVAIPVLASP